MSKHGPVPQGKAARWVECRPGVLDGKPCIRGTRISVELVWGLRKSGATNEEILEAYPHISAEALEAALRFGESYLPLRGQTTTVCFDMPNEVLAALRTHPHRLERELRLAAAIHWYRSGEISMEIAAMAAGLNRRDFLLSLAMAEADVFPVDMAELRRELED